MGLDLNAIVDVGLQHRLTQKQKQKEAEQQAREDEGRARAMEREALLMAIQQQNLKQGQRREADYETDRQREADERTRAESTARSYARRTAGRLQGELGKRANAALQAGESGEADWADVAAEIERLEGFADAQAYGGRSGRTSTSGLVTEDDIQSAAVRLLQSGHATEPEEAVQIAIRMLAEQHRARGERAPQGATERPTILRPDGTRVPLPEVGGVAPKQASLDAILQEWIDEGLTAREIYNLAFERFAKSQGTPEDTQDVMDLIVRRYQALLAEREGQEQEQEEKNRRLREGLSSIREPR